MIEKLVYERSKKAAEATVLIGNAREMAAWMRAGFDEHDEIAESMDDLPEGTQVAYLDYIRARTKGRGAGTRLLEAVLFDLDTRGIPIVYLWSTPDEDTDPARLESWYVAHGFERVEDDPDPLRETVPMRRVGR